MSCKRNAKCIRQGRWYADANPFLSPAQIGLQGEEIYEDCPASVKSYNYKRIKNDLEKLLKSKFQDEKEAGEGISKDDAD
jgi:hypothetical protein